MNLIQPWHSVDIWPERGKKNPIPLLSHPLPHLRRSSWNVANTAGLFEAGCARRTGWPSSNVWLDDSKYQSLGGEELGRATHDEQLQGSRSRGNNPAWLMNFNKCHYDLFFNPADFESGRLFASTSSLSSLKVMLDLLREHNCLNQTTRCTPPAPSWRIEYEIVLYHPGFHA